MQSVPRLGKPAPKDGRIRGIGRVRVGVKIAAQRYRKAAIQGMHEFVCL
jgi:hypothetical protein